MNGSARDGGAPCLLWRRLLPLGGLLMGAAPVAASQPPLADNAATSTLESLPQASAEVAELERLAGETRVVTSMPEPGFGAWLQDFFEALGRGLSTLLSTHLGAASEVAGTLVQWGLGLLLVAILGFAALFFWRWSKQRVGMASSEPATLDAPESMPLAEGADRTQVLRQRLASGDGVGAAEALWWWLADALEPSAEPSWTSRELIARAGRRDLRPLVRRLDGLLYDLGTPAVTEVEGLWRELGEAVG